jgi:hypothetical protein
MTSMRTKADRDSPRLAAARSTFSSVSSSNRIMTGSLRLRLAGSGSVSTMGSACWCAAPWMNSIGSDVTTAVRFRCLASTDWRVEVDDYLVAGQDLGGLCIVCAGWVGEVQDRDGAQGRISVLPRLGDERRDLVDCPQVKAARRERHERDIGDGQPDFVEHAERVLG